MPLSRMSCAIRGLAVVPWVILVSCAPVSTETGSVQASGMLAGGKEILRATIRATTVSAIRQPVTTVKLGLTNLWNRPREILTGNFELDPSLRQPLAEAPGTPEFEALLDRRKFPHAASGSLEWLVDGPGFFPELDRQIAAASQSIHCQVFIFDNDDIAVRYADRLKARAGEVKVRVLFDDLGSTFAANSAPETHGPVGFVPPDDMEDYLEKGSNVRARRILNPWFSCDHTKLLVFDNRTAILGGMNIGREYYSEWHDLMVKVDGPVVAQLSREFNRAWRKAGALGDFGLFRTPQALRRHKPVTGGIPLRVLRTDPAEGRHEVLEASLLAIRGAKKRVWIENPYFAHDDIAVACEAAARRGVDVRVIIPARGDSSIMDIGNLSTAYGLIQAGAKVFSYPGMTHMKVMICDDWASMGSANLDTLSMRINRELNLGFSHPAAVRKLADKVFTPDFSRSRRLRVEETRSASADLAEMIADQL
ncbi:MAG: phosphatidylserine/phosphatidylglycerophosphate/cardiolipin synthase family protein [Verrucomicrobiaceae bacterium]|nr:MAG: phosphatidylserine/phosphatidylglycerophosphate/cardiolipin synthase family protein [Verrucomicrobiaceae bacterium]